MSRKPQMTAAQMEQIANMYRENGYAAHVAKNGRHVIAIKEPVWLASMKASLSAKHYNPSA